MAEVAILGVYKDGPESTDNQVVQGRWSAWRIPNSAPRKPWKEAEGALKATIKLRGSIHLCVYYGENLPMPHDFKSRAIRIKITDDSAKHVYRIG